METIKFVQRPAVDSSVSFTRSKKEKKWKYLNFDFMDEIAPGNDEFVKSMFETFRASVPVSIEKMEASLDHNDYAALAKLAHTIKPTGVYIGVPSLTKMIAELESSTSARIKPTTQKLMAEVKILVGAVLLEINEYFQYIL